MKHNKLHLVQYYLNWVFLFAVIVFASSAKCQMVVTPSKGATVTTLYLYKDTLYNKDNSTYAVNYPSAKPKKTHLSINFAMGRGSFYYPHKNGSDAFSFSLEAELKGKIGYVQFRQSFFEDQPIFNDYSGIPSKEFFLIEQVAVHAYVYKSNPIKVSVGAALQYAINSGVGNLHDYNTDRVQWMPESSVYFAADDRFSWLARVAWFQFKSKNRFGFNLGMSYQLTKN